MTAGAVTNTYDDNGNMVERGGDVFTYDSFNRLVGASVGGGTALYTYNHLDQRVTKTLNGRTRLLVYDRRGNLIAEMDAATENVLAEYIWLDGTPLAFVQSGQTYHVHVDHLGTPKALTDTSGQVVWKADYSPFGKASITSQGPTFNLRFPGQYFDAETGLHYNWHRYYDPTVGRYITSDPIGLAGGINTYSYVEGNPFIFFDPYGLFGMNDVYGGIYSITGGWTPDQSTVDFAAGFGDSISFNLTKQFREWRGICNVSYESDSYVFSNALGTVFGLTNAARSTLVVRKNIKRAKNWRANSRASRKTRQKKIAQAGSYRPGVADATLTFVGGAGVDSFASIIRDINSDTED